MKGFTFAAAVGIVMTGCVSGSKEVNFLESDDLLQKLQDDWSIHVEPEDLPQLNDALDAQVTAFLKHAFGNEKGNENELIFDPEPQDPVVLVESTVSFGLRGYREQDSQVMVVMELPEGFELFGVEVDVTVSHVTLRPILFSLLYFVVPLAFIVFFISGCASIWGCYDDDEDDEDFDNEEEYEEEEYVLENKADALNVSPQEQLKAPLL